jgi:hypothetical protein
MTDTRSFTGTKDVLIRVTASLAAAISILERTPKAKMAAPSNTMFEQMLTDYRNSLEAARAALSQPDPDGVAQAEKQPGWTNRPACSFPEMAPTPPVQDGKGEAVAWRTNTGGATTDKRIAEIWRDKYHFTIEPLYAAPPPASNAGGGTWEPADFWKFVSGLAGEFEADQMRDMLAQSGLQVVGSRDPAYAPSARLARAERALAIISYMSAQCGGDAMKMRDIATDVTLWDRPDSMWWHGKDYGPSVPSTEGKSHD